MSLISRSCNKQSSWWLKQNYSLAGICRGMVIVDFKVHGKCFDSLVAIRNNCLEGMLQTSVA